MPLFLVGLEKLNSVADLFNGDSELLIDGPDSTDLAYRPLSANLGVARIEHTLFNLHNNLEESWLYDVLEVSVKIESAATAQKLLRDIVGTYLLKETLLNLSIDPLKKGQRAARQPPYLVLIHPSNGTRGQTHIPTAATRRTVAFFGDDGIA